MHAIELAVKIIEETLDEKYIICSDSLGVLQSISRKCESNIIRRLLHKFHLLLSRGKTVELCWIPGHVGVAGNEDVDQKAKNAALRVEEFVTISHTDWNPIVREKLNDKWKRRWQGTNDKLLEIRDEPGEWDPAKGKRREQVVVNRLRSGHTNVTHKYLMDNKVPDVPPDFPRCC